MSEKFGNAQEVTYEQLEDDKPDSDTDITEGGLIGAIGGGIVGALAGGPIGAIIGAVVGGGASALAVDAIDQHDNVTDQASTVESEFPASPHQHFDSTGLAGFTEGSVFDGSLEPARVEYIIQEIPASESITFVDIDNVIRLSAYQLWEERGHRDGFDLDDWLDAELELTLALDSADIDDSEQVIVEEVVLY